MVPGARVVQGVPSAPRLAHPGTEERAWFASTSKRKGGRRHVVSTSTHLLPLHTRLPRRPGEALRPHITL